MVFTGKHEHSHGLCMLVSGRVSNVSTKIFTTNHLYTFIIKSLKTKGSKKGTRSERGTPVGLWKTHCSKTTLFGVYYETGYSSWWFHPSQKILVKLETFPK